MENFISDSRETCFRTEMAEFRDGENSEILRGFLWSWNLKEVTIGIEAAGWKLYNKYPQFIVNLTSSTIRVYKTSYILVQGDQINMAVLFCNNLVKVTSPVYATVHANTGQVPFYKVQETHCHV